MRSFTILLILLTFCGYSHGEDEENEEVKPPVEYIPLAPELTVNLRGKRHYLRTSIQLLTEGENTEIVKRHIPAIRHALIMKLSNLKHENLLNIRKREQIRKKAVKSIQEMIIKLEGKGTIKDLFFTTFMVQ